MKIESIVVLNDFCHAQGGASRVAIDEAIALSGRGVDVMFIGAVGPIAPELLAGGVSVQCLGQPELADALRHPTATMRSLWNRPAHDAMQRLLKRLDPRRTIVHLHGYTKALSAAPATAARRAGFATICTLHDFFSACPNGAFYNYRRQAPCTLRALSSSCLVTHCDKRHAVHKIYRYVRGAVQRHVVQFPASVQHYIALSRRSATILQPYLPAEAQLHPLSNIIDVPRAPAADPGANGTLMVVGRLDEEKGVMLAARAAASLRLPILFVGDGPLRPQIEATGARVTGWLPSAEVQRELDYARCLVFPSLWYETFGLVVSEAAARGIPAIVSDVSAAAERVSDERSGWLFRSGDQDALAKRMALTCSDGAVRSAGAAAYQDYWADPSDPERHAQQLLSIYEAVLGAEQACAASSDSARIMAVASSC